MSVSFNEKHTPPNLLSVYPDSLQSNSVLRESYETCNLTVVGTNDPHPATKPDPETLEPPPASRMKAYLTVFGAFCALFCTFGLMNSFGTFQAWYVAHQMEGASHSTIAWIGSLQLWVFFFSGGFVGRAFDVYGPRPLMIIGTICYVMSIMLTSVCRVYYQFLLAQGLLFGVGVGLLFYPSLASVSTHFMHYRATALGIAAAGSSVGGVVFPIILHKLFITLGFAWGLRIAGITSFVGCGIAVLTVSRATPVQKGLPTFNWRTMKDLRFVLLALGGGLVALGLFIPFFYIISFTKQVIAHHPSNLSFLVLAVMNAGGIFGRIIPAYLADRIGNFNLLAPSAFMSGLLCLTVWLTAKNLAAILAFAALYGLFSGAFISVVTPCVAQISDIREIGSRIGLLYSIISFPALFGGPVAGALLAYGRGDYTAMIAFSGATVIAGSVLIWASRMAVNRTLLAKV